MEGERRRLDDGTQTMITTRVNGLQINCSRETVRRERDVREG